MKSLIHPRAATAWVAGGLLAALAGCATAPADVVGPPRKETLHALTQSMKLLTLNAGQPRTVLKRVAVTGLPAGDSLVGIDYRVAKGVLYGVSRKGLLFTMNTDTGALTAVSPKPLDQLLVGSVQ